MKIALFWANPYSTNLGVGALTYSIIYLLESLKNDSKFEIYIIGTATTRTDNDVLKIGNLEVPIINVRNFAQTGVKGFIKRIIYYSQYRKYSKFDYVMDIGEGDSYTDIYGDIRINLLNSTKQIFIKKRIKLLLLPQTIGPFNNLSIKNKAIKTLEKCNVILARDQQSVNFLRENTMRKNIDEVIDVAFFMPYQKKNFPNDFVNVGLNISGLLWNGGYAKNNQFDLIVDYQKLIHNIIDCFLTYPNIKIHLVSHVLSTNMPIENDYEVSYDLFERYNNEKLILAPFFSTPIQAKNYIAGLDFFMGARMHATIAAFSSGVPVYPMAYSRKFNGLFMDTLDYPYMGDMKAQTNNEILDGIKNAFEKRNNLKEVIQNKMIGVVAEREEKLTKHLVDFLQLQ